MPSFSSNTSRKGHPQTIDPEGEFCLPVLLPNDPEWVAMFLGALERLGNRSTWDYDEGGDYVVVSDRWKQIARETANAYQAALSCAVEAPDEGEGCLEVGAFHPAISYYPNHPILSPGEDGPYVSPIWGTGAGYIGATGADAMIDPLGFLGQTVADIINGGIVPSAELSFSGSGEIDVHLIQTIQGGAVWIFPDGNPLLGDLVSLSFTDLTELLGVETLIDAYELIFQADLEAFVRVHTVNFETEGDHTLTMWFFPTVDPEPPFVGSGGGLRSIQLCGNATVLEDIVVPYTIELDGDSLNLLADGAVVSEISKATLQSFLDKWVDETGDTMTGTLVSNTPSPQIFQNSGVPIGKVTTTGSQLRYQYEAGKAVLLQGVGSNGSELFYGDALIRMLDRRTLAVAPPSGGIRMSAYNVTVALSIMQSVPNIDLLWGYSYDSVKRWAVSHYGRLQMPAVDGYAYSSNSTWRKQFGLQGAWTEEADAVRLGGMSVELTSHTGDYPVIEGFFPPTVDDVTMLRFHGPGASGSARQLFRPAEGLEMWALTGILQNYGLIEIEDQVDSPLVDTMDLAQRCSAAYYMAESLAGFIEDVFDNLETVTGLEVINGLIETYGIKADVARQVVIASITAIAHKSGILDDLTDPSIIAVQLQICDFDQECFFEWLDSYGGFATVTIVILKEILSLVWGTLVVLWLNVGAVTPNENCESIVWPCEDREFDFRYIQPLGVEIQQGSVPGAGGGLVVGTSGSNWGSWVEWRLQGCTILNVHVEYDVVYIPQQMHITWFSGSEGDWLQQGTIAVGHSATGPDDYDSGALFGSAGNTTRILVRMENEPTASAANVIYHVNFSMGS